METANTKINANMTRYSDNKYRCACFAILAITLLAFWPGGLLDSEDLVLVPETVAVCTLTLVNTEVGVFIKNHKRLDLMAFNLIELALIPVFAHFALVLGGDYDKCINWLAIAAGASLLIGVLTWTNAISRQKKTVSKRAIAEGLYRAQVIFITVLMIQVLYISVVGHGSSGVASDDFQKASASRGACELQEWNEDRTVAAYYDTLRVLKDEEQFALVDEQERFRIFTAICDVEANYLGVPYKLTIKAEPIKEEGVIGQYCHHSRTIVIDDNYLTSATAEGLIKVASHEVRHAYTWAVINLNKNLTDPASRILLADLLNEGDRYAESYEAYKSNGLEYFSQYVEEDCRDYADQAYCDLLQRLEELEGEQ